MTVRPIVSLLSGPNLNLLGEREPEVYGTDRLDELVEAATRRGEQLGLSIEHVQSNHEGDLVDAVQSARGRTAAIIINPAAYTHSSWALHDALAAYDGHVVELHLSNPAGREPWRSTSVVAPVATATISGLGAAGYPLAVDAVASLLALDRDG